MSYAAAILFASALLLLSLLSVALAFSLAPSSRRLLARLARAMARRCWLRVRGGQAEAAPQTLKIERLGVDLLAPIGRLPGGEPSSCGPALVAALYAASFPLVLELLTDPAWPLPLLGAVHVRSSLVCATIEVGVLRSCDVTCAWTRASSRHVARGTEADIEVVVRQHGSMSVLWRSTATMLFFEAPREVINSAAGGEQRRAPHADEGQLLDLVAARPLVLPAGLASAWTAVSGDVNPIHTSDWAAWVLGFRRGAIAHGMSVVYAAAPQLVDARGLAPRSSGPSTRLDVKFLRPIFVSARPHLGLVVVRRGDRQVEFTICEQLPAGAKALVSGSLRRDGVRDE